MDGSHPKNIDPRPKRRRDEENPYEIYTTGINTTHPRYFLAFTDSNKVKRWMEIDKTLNTSSTSNKVDTANDKCTFAGKLADGNYVWSVTENGTTVASGSFTLDRGV